jgi:hypothetical protein
MDESLCKFTTKFRNYNKMDEWMRWKWWCRWRCCCDDEDDAKSSKGLCSFKDWWPRACFTSRSLLELRFLRIPVSLDLWFVICLHKAELFKGTKPTDRLYMHRYGQALPVLVLVKLHGASPREALPPRWAYWCSLNSLELIRVRLFHPGTWIIILESFVIFNLRIYPKKNGALSLFFKWVFRIWNPAETSIKGARKRGKMVKSYRY